MNIDDEIAELEEKNEKLRSDITELNEKNKTPYVIATGNTITVGFDTDSLWSVDSSDGNSKSGAYHEMSP